MQESDGVVLIAAKAEPAKGKVDPKKGGKGAPAAAASVKEEEKKGLALFGGMSALEVIGTRAGHDVRAPESCFCGLRVCSVWFSTFNPILDRSSHGRRCHGRRWRRDCALPDRYHQDQAAGEPAPSLAAAQTDRCAHRQLLVLTLLWRVTHRPPARDRRSSGRASTAAWLATSWCVRSAPILLQCQLGPDPSATAPQSLSRSLSLLPTGSHPSKRNLLRGI